jgi:hypothetical protein
MKTIFTIIVAFIFFLSVPFFCSKYGRSAGKIVDRKTVALIGVTITVEKTQIVTQTDIDGKFILSNIPTGVQPQSNVRWLRAANQFNINVTSGNANILTFE